MPKQQLDLSTAKPVLSWANHQLGAQETQMAKNVASLPFVFKHVALMPDVLLGKGALVGSSEIYTKYMVESTFLADSTLALGIKI